MSQISLSLKKFVLKIKEFADGPFQDQKKSFQEYLLQKLFPRGIDTRIIQEILPSVIKFLISQIPLFQRQNRNIAILKCILTVLCKSFNGNKYEEILHQMFNDKESENICNYENDEIKEIINMITDFINGHLKQSIAINQGVNSERKEEDDDDCVIIEAPINSKNRKRPFNAKSENQNSRIKRSRTLLESTNESSNSIGENKERIKFESGNYLQCSSSTVTLLEIKAVKTNRNENDFPEFEYSFPSESFLKKCCKSLGLEFDRVKYIEFLSKIAFDSVNSNLKPDSIFSTIDKSGFGSFSVFFTGNEESTETIKNEINKFYVQNLSGGDLEKIVTVGFSPCSLMLEEHFETIVSWFKCRILVYCNFDGWKRYGDWKNSEDENIPTFVLEKKKINENTVIFQIVLSFKNSDM